MLLAEWVRSSLVYYSTLRAVVVLLFWSCFECSRLVVPGFPLLLHIYWLVLVLVLAWLALFKRSGFVCVCVRV